MVHLQRFGQEFIGLLHLAIGPLSRLFTSQINFVTESRTSWDYHIQFSPALREELHFWYKNIDAYNGFGKQPQFCPGAVIDCDASNFAFGGYCVNIGDEPVRGMFNSSERLQVQHIESLKLFTRFSMPMANSFLTKK